MINVGFQSQVQELLPEVEARMRSLADGYQPELGNALHQLLDAGGKRVRPTLALLVAGMLNVPHDLSITLAAAVEVLHTATLVHDDLIDGAMLRRGNPTLNAKWNSAATILAGDFLFSQAAWLGAQVGSVEVMQMFAKTLSVIVDGEIKQIFTRHNFPSRSEYKQGIYAKTASMFELAANSPAYLMNVVDEYGERLRAYGYGVGMAFQTVDDILDFSSDTQTLGKPVASDLRIGLITLPTLLFAEMNPKDSRVLKLKRGEHLEDAEVEALLGGIRGSGAVQRAHDEAGLFVSNALDALDHLPACPERYALAELANYVTERLQ